jgi:hypothetical protein
MMSLLKCLEEVAVSRAELAVSLVKLEDFPAEAVVINNDDQDNLVMAATAGSHSTLDKKQLSIFRIAALQFTAKLSYPPFVCVLISPFLLTRRPVMHL